MAYRKWECLGLDHVNYLYERKCLQNIKKIYKQAGKCDKQQQFRDIPESAMVYTTEGFANDSPISPMTSTPVNT